MPRTAVRTFLIALGTAGMLVMASGVASAHVTVTPTSAPSGQDTTLTFRVPDERSDVSTTGLKIVLADGASLREVSVLPKSGWDVSTAPPAAGADTAVPTPAAPPTSMPGMSMPGMSMPAASPSPSSSGGSDEDSGPAVGSITWTARESSFAIHPDQFQEFEILAAMPSDRTSLVFAALQTYSDGTVVRWIDRAAPGGAEPAHPAPVVTLMAPGSTSMSSMPGMSMPDPSAAPSTASGKSNTMGGMSMSGMSGMDMSAPRSDSVNVSLAVGIAALIASMLGAILAMNAMTRARRNSRPAPPADCH